MAAQTPDQLLLGTHGIEFLFDPTYGTVERPPPRPVERPLPPQLPIKPAQLRQQAIIQIAQSLAPSFCAACLLAGHHPQIQR